MVKSVLGEKSSFKLLELFFSFELDWGSYIAKVASKKTGALICSVKFLTSKVLLYLHKSCSLAWNTIVMSGLVLLIAKWI